MFYQSTAAVLRPIADSLTDRKLRLFNKNPEIPVPVFELAQAYDGATAADESLAAIYDRFMHTHAPERSAQREELVTARDQIVANMVTGIKGMLATTRQHIIPTGIELATEFREKREKNLHPNITVIEYHAHPALDDLALQEHVYSLYQDLPATPEVETFLLKPVATSAIRSMIRGNTHLSEGLTESWLDSLSDHTLETLYRQLFLEGRTVRVGDLGLLSGGEIEGEHWYGKTFAGSNLLAAYLLTQYLRDNPQPLGQDSVGIEQWELVLGNLHKVIGAYLREYYIARAANKQRGRLILTHSPTAKIEQGDFMVILNGDLDEAQVKAINTQAIIGAVMDGGHSRDLAQLTDPEQSERYLKIWNARYRALSQARKADSIRTSVQLVERLLTPRPKLCMDLFGSEEGPGDMHATWRERLHNEIRGLSGDQLDDPERMFVTLICKVYFRRGAYLSFLQSMDEWAGTTKANSRTAATQALIDTMVNWLAEQVGSEFYTPVPQQVPVTTEVDTTVVVEDDAIEEDSPVNPDAIAGATPANDDGNPLHK